ncbi:MAG: hypothetical protein NZM43_09220 [Saprospiraceae bacterium]|nr:hypothetical protein [Saprospiraceae bacterium]MDW8484494.1 hypothetical protein [Saprospiraceae bacterium]
MFISFFIERGAALWAQDQTPSVSEEYLLIRAKDGNTYVGRLIRQDSTFIVLETKIFAELPIPRKSIRHIRTVPRAPLDLALVVSETPVAGNYFANGSAYGMQKGECYIATTPIFYHQVSIGVSKHLSLQGSLVLDVEDFYFPVWIAPKISFPLRADHLILALEGLFGRGFYTFTDYEWSKFSAFQGLLTMGSRLTHITLGTGFGRTEGGWARKPFFSISGSAQVGSNFTLISENYLFSIGGQSAKVHAVGGRAYIRRVSAEFGIVLQLGYVWETIESQVIPFVGLRFNFY